MSLLCYLCDSEKGKINNYYVHDLPRVAIVETYAYFSSLQSEFVVPPKDS